MFDLIACVSESHDWRLVSVAALICVLCCLATINLLRRATATVGRARQIWIGLAAAAGGGGIWATHFVAMLAYKPGVAVGFMLGLTILSLFVAVGVSGLGLLVALSLNTRAGAAAGGFVVGCGIVAMHYTGMAALVVPGDLSWRLPLVAISIIFGTAFATAAFAVASGAKSKKMTILAAALLAAAILSHHFIAMSAAIISPDLSKRASQTALESGSLGLLIAVAACGILGMCLVAALGDGRAQSQSRARKLQLKATLENISQGVCMFDADGRVLLFNARYAEMTGDSGDALEGRCLLQILKDRSVVGGFSGDPQEFFARLTHEMKQGLASVKTMKTPNGSTLRIAHRPTGDGGWVTTMEDITDWRKAEERISHMSTHDPLTDLPNRAHFRECLDDRIRGLSHDGAVAVLYLDIDNFRNVNEMFGHAAGDEFLVEVASRLATCRGKTDMLARVRGAEFALFVERRGLMPGDVAAIAERMHAALVEPIKIGAAEAIADVNTGIAIAPPDSFDSDLLLKSAYLALDRAKAAGRGEYRLFEAEMDAQVQARRIMEIAMRGALANGEFEIYYQPIYRADDAEVSGFEALLRWNDPRRGMISPAEFIPLAEETGLIVSIGEWVLRKACLDAAGWSRNVRVAVNLSPIQIGCPHLVSMVTSALAMAGLDPRRLELEITESVMMKDTERTLETLRRLRQIGIRIAMDDFGTGYSSLGYLRSFPFDKIKIDQSFVREIEMRKDVRAIVRAVTGLAKCLGITTTAEGVETEAQFNLLRDKGCTEVQGYLFSSPRPARDVEFLLSRQGAWRVAA